jgi:hypothetical protein
MPGSPPAGTGRKPGGQIGIPYRYRAGRIVWQPAEDQLPIRIPPW